MSIATAQLPESIAPVAAATILYLSGQSPDHRGVSSRLSSMGLTVLPVATLREALGLLQQQPVTLCIVDLADDLFVV